MTLPGDKQGLLTRIKDTIDTWRDVPSDAMKKALQDKIADTAERNILAERGARPPESFPPGNYGDKGQFMEARETEYGIQQMAKAQRDWLERAKTASSRGEIEQLLQEKPYVPKGSTEELIKTQNKWLEDWSKAKSEPTPSELGDALGNRPQGPGSAQPPTPTPLPPGGVEKVGAEGGGPEVEIDFGKLKPGGGAKPPAEPPPQLPQVPSSPPPTPTPQPPGSELPGPGDITEGRLPVQPPPTPPPPTGTPVTGTPAPSDTPITGTPAPSDTPITGTPAPTHTPVTGTPAPPGTPVTGTPPPPGSSLPSLPSVPVTAGGVAAGGAAAGAGTAAGAAGTGLIPWIIGGVITIVVIVGGIAIANSGGGSSPTGKPAGGQGTGQGTGQGAGGGTGQPGFVNTSGVMDLSPLGPDLVATVNVAADQVSVSFPSEGGAVDPSSTAFFKLEDFPIGKITYALSQGLACSFGGALTGGAAGDDCSNVSIPPEYESCVADYAMTAQLQGTYDAATMSFSGTAVASTQIVNSTTCPPDALAGGNLPPQSGTWSGTFDGTTITGTIALSVTYPFTATAA